MTSNRSYRKYLPQDVVRAEIEKGKGTQFDPVIAEKMQEINDSDKEYKFHEKRSQKKNPAPHFNVKFFLLEWRYKTHSGTKNDN